MLDMTIATVWLEFTIKVRTVATKDALGDLLVETYGKLGFGYVNISLLKDYSLPKEELAFGWKSTYPKDWGQYYIERDCIRFDPVALCARGDVGPFFWSDLKVLLDLTPLQTTFLGLADEAGLYNGVGLPFMGPNAHQGGIALATLSPETDHVRNLDLLWSISNLFYRRLRELVSGPAIRMARKVDLTPREADVLILSATGLTDREIAKDLEISDHTVNSHFRKSFRKLEAHNRLQAYAKAVKHHLIDLPYPNR